MILIGRFFIGIFKWMVRRIIRFTIILAILAALILVGVPHLMKHCFHVDFSFNPTITTEGQAAPAFPDIFSNFK